MGTTPLPDESAHLYAYLCAGLADPTRIQILHLLHGEPKNVNTLARLLGLSQPAVSRHLKILRERGLVRARRHKQAVFYELNDPRIIAALDLLRAIIRDHLQTQAQVLDAGA